jgi:thymidine kinase
MRGGLVFFRGAGAAARAYLESDHSHADEYYLANAGAVAQWSALDNEGTVYENRSLDGMEYQSWVDWIDPEFHEQRGTPRAETRIDRNGEIVVLPASPRFVEMTVNCNKSLSVAAALDPAVSAALDEAQATAASAMTAYMAQNSVTRVGPRGAQYFVPVDRLESVSVVHRSSRAGDPHRHVHVQWNTRVLAQGQWRALHTAATLKQQGALRGVGEAAINSHDGLQEALAAAGYEFEASSGRVTNLEQHARTMSKRANQIQGNAARLEAEWRLSNPGVEPDAAQRREWDQKAWAFERPRKKQAAEHAETKWVSELRAEGLQVDGFAAVERDTPLTLDELDRDELAARVVAAAGARASSWSVADLEGHIGVAVGAAGVRATKEELGVFVRAVAADITTTLPRLDMAVPGQVPSWVRHLTSEHVQRVEDELRKTFQRRGLDSGLVVDPDAELLAGLNAEQSVAARAMATRAPLLVVEGAAGSGKTTMLAAARDLAAEDGVRFVVLAPTLRAANEAGKATGSEAVSAHKLAHEYGFRWDDDGRWQRLDVGDVDAATGAIYEGPSERFQVDADTRLVIDEAGMLDQDLAHAVMTIADEQGAPVALVGDRAQLPAIGRGGVLDMAVAAHPRPLDLSELYRFREEGYGALTLDMRDRKGPKALFKGLQSRGNIVVHATEEEAWAAVTADVAVQAKAGASVAVAVSTNEQAATISALVQQAHADAGRTRKAHVEVAGMDGLTLRVGDRIMTRENAKAQGVANRDTWTVKRVDRDGSVVVRDGRREATLPREYVEASTHLAYASTVYGVQGATVDYGHGVVTEATSAQALYVAATRGRDHNALHVVAGDVDEARDVFVGALGRESGDRGIDAARESAQRDLEGMVLPSMDHDEQVRAARLDAEERAYQVRLRSWEGAQEQWQLRHPDLAPADYADALAAAESDVVTATAERERLESVVPVEAVATHEQQWATDYAAVQTAETTADSSSVFRRAAAQRAVEDARRQFQDRHRAAPAARPTEAQRAAWAKAATTPGATPALDCARAAEVKAKTAHRHLRVDAAPSSTPPAPPTRGRPDQEGERDEAFQAKTGAAAQTKATADQDRAAQMARERSQAPKDQAPVNER